MATPRNPLDKYSSYTYYFELHAHYNSELLQQLGDTPSSQSTTRFEPNDTLVINGFKDAHQVMEEVQINVLNPPTTKTEVLSSFTQVNMTVIEPGGFSFIEKIDRLMKQNSTGELASLSFLLRIFFVGRMPDNTVETEYGGSLALVILDFDGTFTERGGQYRLEFVTDTSVGTITVARPDSVQRQFAFTNRAIAFEAKTVQEAFKKYEQKLNETYAYDIERNIDNRGTRKLKWKIEVDPEVKGSISTINGTSFSFDSNKQLYITARKQVASGLQDILKRSPEIQARIGASSKELSKQLHKDVFIPYIESKVVASEDEVTITYYVKVYRGGEHIKYEFDYYFSPAGRNVDVLSYEVAFKSLVSAWIGNHNTLNSTDTNLNLSAERAAADPTGFSSNTLTKDKTVPNLQGKVPERVVVDPDSREKDISYRHVATSGMVSGYNTIKAASMPAMAFGQGSLALGYGGNVNMAPVFEIRGHLDLLRQCTITVDDAPHLNAQGTWMKVNIFMPDGAGGVKQFFYTGYYWVVGVTNNFKEGKFIQVVSLIAKDE